MEENGECGVLLFKCENQPNYFEIIPISDFMFGIKLVIEDECDEVNTHGTKANTKTRVFHRKWRKNY